MLFSQGFSDVRNQVQFQKGLSEASFAEIYELKSNVMRRSSNGAGRTGSNVLYV